MSKTRSRLPHEVHDKIFGWVLALVAGHDLVKAERIGVDGSTMEANAALRTIVRRDTGESYREMLTRMAKESGIATPSADDLVRLDRQRKGKKLSNADWESPTDPDAKVARMKNGTTRLAYKPEHAVDLDTGVIVAAPIHPADQGDTNTLDPTLKAAAHNLAGIGLAPTSEDRCDLVTDKGYHSRDGPQAPRRRRLEDAASPSPAPANGVLRWHGDEAAQKAVYANRARLKSAVGRRAMRRRGEMVERSFAHVLDRGGMRRVWLRGRENVHKRYLIHVAGFNLGDPHARPVRLRHPEGGGERLTSGFVRPSDRCHASARLHRRVRWRTRHASDRFHPRRHLTSGRRTTKKATRHRAVRAGAPPTIAGNGKGTPCLSKESEFWSPAAPAFSARTCASG